MAALWPVRRKRPDSEITSQTTHAPSTPPEARREVLEEKVRTVRGPEWPVRIRGVGGRLEGDGSRRELTGWGGGDGGC